MPPMCTPEKADNTKQQLNNIEEYYFVPGESALDSASSTDTTASNDSDRDEEEKMENLLATFPDLEKHFELHGRVGEGTFSTVYVAVSKYSSDKRFAIKYIVPTCHPDRIRFELDCLKTIGGVDNVAGIYCCLRNKDRVAFVMPHQSHNNFSEYVSTMDVEEVKLYMKNLLIALARVHSFNIIHRDIKPSNFLYDKFSKTFLLVDFGLAQKSNSNLVDEVEATQSTRKRKRNEKSSPSLDEIKQAKKCAALQTRQIHLTRSQLTTSLPISKSFNDAPPKENRPNVFDVPKGQQLQKQRVSDKHHRKKYSCGCYGKAKVCSSCMVHPPMQASRAGTPGFRPPEVLFKVSQQTTAVDIWAAGVIMLAILSKCSNFFSCPSDIAALLELVTIFGYENINKVANKFGRYFICSEKKPELDLRKICCTLRNRGDKIHRLLKGTKCKLCGQFVRVCLCKNVPLDKEIVDEFQPSTYDLLHRLLDLNPNTRISAREALQHPFFQTV